MTTFARWKKHAYYRFLERSSLNFNIIQGILFNEKYIKIGEETGKNREHLLFYSLIDSYHYIVVRDYKTNEVITFLPYEYHQNLAWKISDDILEEAVEMANSNKKPELKDVKLTVKKEEMSEYKRYHVTCSYLTANQEIKTLRIGKYKKNPLNEDNVLSKQIISECEARLKAKGVCPDLLNAIIIEDRKLNEFMTVRI